MRPFWAASDREVALAYAAEPTLRHLAVPMLERVAREKTTDAEPLAQLAQIYDGAGRVSESVALYERVLRLNPSHPSAGNLAVHRFQAGRTREAIDLWQGVFERNPALASAGINLALAQMKTGQTDAARKTLDRVLRFHPDLATARKLLTLSK